MERLLEYIQLHPFLASLAVAMALAVLVFELRSRGQDYSAVQPQEAIRLMNQGAQVVRPARQGGLCRRATSAARSTSIPASIEQAGETLKKLKESTLLLVCCETAQLPRTSRASCTPAVSRRCSTCAAALRRGAPKACRCNAAERCHDEHGHAAGRDVRHGLVPLLHPGARAVHEQGRGLRPRSTSRPWTARAPRCSSAAAATPVPQIFVGDRHLGGFDDMNALDGRGELDPILAAAAARNSLNPHLLRTTRG